MNKNKGYLIVKMEKYKIVELSENIRKKPVDKGMRKVYIKRQKI